MNDLPNLVSIQSFGMIAQLFKAAILLDEFRVEPKRNGMSFTGLLHASIIVFNLLLTDMLIEIACRSLNQINAIGLVNTLRQTAGIKNHGEKFIEQSLFLTLVSQSQLVYGQLIVGLTKEFLSETRHKLVARIMVIDAI